jgi:hypothetical protein
VRVERNLLNHFKLIWVVQSLPRKHSALHPTQISGICALSRPDKRGVSRSSRTRDGMRWTQQYRKTNDAGCGRRSRVVLTPRRWRQARQAIDERRWQQSPVTGESTKEAVKTIARETPGHSGEPVVTNSSCFFISHARLRVHRAPGVSRALCFLGRNEMHNSGAIARRDRGGVRATA